MAVSEMRSDAGLFGQYAGTATDYDEVFAAPGGLRPHWRRFVVLSGALGKDEFARRWDQARRLLEQQGLTYPDPSDPAGQRRPWKLDPDPLLLAADEWPTISAALCQRATLLDLLLRDLYVPGSWLRLAGADASHAWISAFCGPLGWVDFDPTNDTVVSDLHVTVGWGRDYGDVCPIQGVFVGGGQHRMKVGVDMIPLPALT